MIPPAKSSPNMMLIGGVVLVILLVVGWLLFGLSAGGVIPSDAPATAVTAPTVTKPPATTPPATAVTAPTVTKPAVTPPPATPPPPQPPAYEPFSIGALKDTGFNDDGGGNAVYVDRHNIDCGVQGVQRLHYQRNPANQSQFRYDYTCANGGSLGAATPKNTGFNDEGGGNTIYLDRHNIDCGDNSVMSQLKLNRDGAGKFKYDYTCLSSNAPLTCRDVTTPANDWGGGKSIFLDRHDLKCNDNEAMSQFHLTRPSDNTIQYNFKCCKKA